MRRRYLLPAITLAIGLLASLAAALLLSRASEERRAARFEAAADEIVAAVESRMLAQLTLLRGAAGFFNASEEVSRENFRAYVARLRLELYYPGVLGIGYAAAFPDRRGVDALAARVAATEVPGYRAWPEGERPDHSAILYLEPMNRMNRAALGFDMLSEAMRRAAMDGARESGMARMSGRVRLVQEIEPVKQPGFLLYLPLYRESDGRQQHYGWVYSPLRAHDLFDAIFADNDLNGTILEIYDDQVTEEGLLYRTGEIGATPARATVRPLETAGRTWRIRVASGPDFAPEGPFTAPLIVALGGALVSLLIAALMFQQIRARERTEREVALRTAELSAANMRMQVEAEARRSAEAQVRQMQKIEAIGQLTGGIAHDFNNMLAVIIGNLDIVERRSGDPARQARALANARTGAERAAELTQRLLAFGRQQALTPRVLDPNGLIEDMTDLLARSLGESIRLETRLSDGIWRIRADQGELENAILNLAINARDAMPEGGALTIATENRHLHASPEGGAGEIDPGDYVVIIVADTGEGMTPEVAARAIDPFFTTKEIGRGTGLGLSQVYGFVRQSGGHLSLESKEKAGTRVTICLPRHLGEEQAVRREPRSGSVLPPGRTEEVVLVVEDEPQVREISAGGLRELGYTVLEASGGAEALAILASPAGVSLLFTDMVMPEMNGCALADEACRRRPDLKLLFTTGYAGEGRGQSPGHPAATLKKPFTLDELAAAVRNALDS